MVRVAMAIARATLAGRRNGPASPPRNWRHVHLRKLAAGAGRRIGRRDARRHRGRESKSDRARRTGFRGASGITAHGAGEDRGPCAGGVPIGIREGGLQLQAREDLRFEAIDPLTGKAIQSATMKFGEKISLSAGGGGLILKGEVLPPKQKRDPFLPLAPDSGSGSGRNHGHIH